MVLFETKSITEINLPMLKIRSRKLLFFAIDGAKLWQLGLTNQKSHLI